jgi:hypothetical protein
VRIGIESNRGTWVQALLAPGHQTYAINAMSVPAVGKRHSPRPVRGAIPSVPLEPGKTLAYVVLPYVTDQGQVAQITALHVFAMSVGN